MSRLIFHIGSHKAGSTSIQEYAAAHRADLLDAGIYYPPGIGRNGNQHSDMRAWLAADDWSSVSQYIDGCAFANSAHTVFLSGEDMCWLGPYRARRFVEIARKRFAEVQIVLILRNKRDHFYSLFRHSLKYSQQPITERRFAKTQTFSPRQCIANWQPLDVKMEVLLFDQLKRDLVGNFFAATLGVVAADNRVSNQSGSYAFLRIMNDLLKGDPEAVALWHEMTRGTAGRYRLPIEDRISDDLADAYPDDDWRLPEFDPDGLLLASVLPRETERGDLYKRMADLFTALAKRE